MPPKSFTEIVTEIVFVTGLLTRFHYGNGVGIVLMKRFELPPPKDDPQEKPRGPLFRGLISFKYTWLLTLGYFTVLRHIMFVGLAYLVAFAVGLMVNSPSVSPILTLVLWPIVYVVALVSYRKFNSKRRR